MQELALQARKLMESFDRVTYTWIPRAKNEVADHLSNVAMDAAASGHAPGVVGGVDAIEAVEESGDADCEIVVSEDATSGTPAHWTGASTPPTRLVLLRHGQTAMSAARVYSGHTDAELTTIGVAQARAAAAQLAQRGGVDVIVSSPLKRCVQTAHAAGKAFGLNVEIIDDLIEMDFGEWEGKTFDEAHATHPQLHSDWIADPTLAPPNGEELAALHRRVTRVRRDLVTRFPGQTVLVISHVTPIKSLIRETLDAGPHLMSRVFLDLASISVIEFYEEDALVPACLRQFNDTSHLR